MEEKKKASNTKTRTQHFFSFIPLPTTYKCNSPTVRWCFSTVLDSPAPRSPMTTSTDALHRRHTGSSVRAVPDDDAPHFHSRTVQKVHLWEFLSSNMGVSLRVVEKHLKYIRKTRREGKEEKERKKEMSPWLTVQYIQHILSLYTKMLTRFASLQSDAQHQRLHHLGRNQQLGECGEKNN